MSEVIWKFPIPVTDHFNVEMPVGAKVLHVAMQGGAPSIWALVDPIQVMEERRFRLAVTGHPLTDPGEYVGTFMVNGGTLVFHLFVEVGA